MEVIHSSIQVRIEVLDDDDDDDDYNYYLMTIQCVSSTTLIAYVNSTKILLCSTSIILLFNYNF